jgi:hypothetical protein
MWEAATRKKKRPTNRDEKGQVFRRRQWIVMAPLSLMVATGGKLLREIGANPQE